MCHVKGDDYHDCMILKESKYNFVILGFRVWCWLMDWITFGFFCGSMAILSQKFRLRISLQAF